MKKSLLLAALALSSAATMTANSHLGIMIDAAKVSDIDNFQEFAAADYFTKENPDGTVIAPGETSKIDATKLDCIWIHIDRCNVGIGNLPAAFSDEATVKALKKFVADGGNLLLTKQATQLLTAIGRIDASFAPGIYGDGDGGEGFDDWNVNAYLGYWSINPDNAEPFEGQLYDRRNHPIYEGLSTSADFAWETYPMEGTGNPETSLWREDHNCMWDLNAYTYTAEGPNTVIKFEKENNAVVLGTWGHVQDYAVAGIVEFLPATVKDNERAGHIIANGLAACEWSPRTGVNAYHSNLTRLTSNCLAYLAKNHQSGVADIEVSDEDASVEYYTLQGVRVAPEALGTGLYIRRQGAKATKVLVK